MPNCSEPLRAAGADGVMSDEWGYDVIIRIEDESTDPDYYKKREIVLRARGLHR